jgi:hypothetical protein
MVNQTSSYLSLDDTVMIKVLPQFDVDEPGVFEELAPLRFGPLHASIEGHHDEVEARLYFLCACVGQNQIMDEKLRVPRTHGRLYSFENEMAVLIRPVVYNVMEEVSPCTGVIVSVVFELHPPSCVPLTG